MLVLSRKEGERLVIGENVIITVTRISGNRITLGIEAPRDVRVMRGELERHDEGHDEPSDKSAPNEKRVYRSLGTTCEMDFSPVAEHVGS